MIRRLTLLLRTPVTGLRLYGNTSYRTTLRQRLARVSQKSKTLVLAPFGTFKTIRIDTLLIGQQAGFPLDAWISLSHDYSRVSRPLPQSPYVTFLRHARNDETLLTDDRLLENEEYFKMGMTCIQAVGSFMGAENPGELKEWMRDYFALLTKGDSHFEELRRKPGFAGHSKRGAPIRVCRLRASQAYEVVDGHHRIALAYLSGRNTVDAKVIGSRYSLLQKMLLSIEQTNGIELYQPVDRTEVRDWRVVRMCTDRFEMMKQVLKERRIHQGTMLDLACSYGWFAHHFKKEGFSVLGLDRDEGAIEIARLVYGLEGGEVQLGRIENFFGRRKKYDVVLCLSILHHYAIGKERGGVESILRGLDSITGKVLFIDTGQNHESWYRRKLHQWDEEFIIQLIGSRTSFGKIVALGKDGDCRGKYMANYGRTLFACIR